MNGGGSWTPCCLSLFLSLGQFRLRQPKPKVLSLADHPGRTGGLSPAVAGAVSANWSDSTRRAYSGQWRQFVARAKASAPCQIILGPTSASKRNLKS